MALNSPGVSTQEKDLTFNIQSITSNATGYVGMFRWGPANEIVDITTNESELVQRFGQPDNATTTFFHAAANYLLYSVPLSLVRVVGSGAKNAVPDAEFDGTIVRNLEEYEVASLDGISFLGKYPGDLANAISVYAADATAFPTWQYASEFEFAPEGNQFSIVVIDRTGQISGIPGSILERYELVSKTPGAKRPDGSSAYVVEAIKNQSEYILVGDVDAIDFEIEDEEGLYSVDLANGADDNDPDNADFISAWDLFNNKETVDVVRYFTAFSPVNAVIRAIDIADSRLDSVVFHACQLSDVYNTLDRVNNLTTYFGTTINKPTSYAFNIDNWKMVYDKYNDKNIWIPCDSDVAGLHSRVFVQNEPWFSPAGFNRGHLRNVIKLAWSSNEPQRNVLYKQSINSIVSFKGEGTVLSGDKTGLRAPSAFGHLNVRTLFIVMKKAISRAARYQLFEFNDFITQSIFRNATDRYLDDIKARRGVTNKKVVCDSTNNTAQVLNNNEFVGDIYVKPNRSINYIKLNFVAVAEGVSFDEIEGA